MKKALSFALLTTLSGTAMADDWGLFVIADAWQRNIDGEMGTQAANDHYSYDNKTQLTLDVALEHSIILLPNARMRYNSFSAEGKNSNDQTGRSEINNLDTIFYYQLLDNQLVEVDLGVNMKYLNGDISPATVSDSSSFSGVLPMGYAAAKVGIPGTHFRVFADLSGASLTGDPVYDATAGVSYTFNPDATLDWTVRLGYRDTQLKMGDFDGLRLDQHHKGWFLGVQAHL